MNLLVIAFAFTLLSTSCNRKETTSAPLPDPYLELWHGEDTLYTPENNMQVASVTVSDNKVLTASVTGGKAFLKTVEAGGVDVEFTGIDGRKEKLRVWVRVPFYMWRSLVNHATYKPQVKVKIADAALSAAVTKELTEKLAKPYYINFRNEDSAWYFNIPETQRFTAWYSYKDLRFILKVNGETNEYKVLTHKDRKILGLEQDLTTRYQALHPGKGVELVVTVEYVQDQLPPG
ncbi:hypothetical protein [Filimonas zeae]|nr:hypothetical protein [Filimonas zeae]